MSVETQSKETAGTTAFEPRIVAFVCKWCTYAGADLAGTSRMPYAPNVRTLMLPCTGRIDITFVLRAFLQGADGVLVSGCHPGDCHYTAGNFRARRRWTLLRDLLDTVGFDLRRLDMAWISAAEGAKWVKTIQAFTDKIRDLGPYEAMHKVAADHEPPAAPRANGELSPVAHNLHGEPAPASPELISAVKDALSTGKVKAVVGWVRNWTLSRLRPIWLVGAEDAGTLAAPADNPMNLRGSSRTRRSRHSHLSASSRNPASYWPSTCCFRRPRSSRPGSSSSPSPPMAGSSASRRSRKRARNSLPIP